jgi:hypothetical protein
MSQGAVNGPQDIADMFVKLVELAKKTNEPQQYISTSFSMSITVLP